MRQWILLVYKIPNDPSAKRVSVWRKLKRLGAVLMHDGAWVLPATDQTREQFQWLAAEIIELDGEASVWDSDAVPGAQEEALVREFTSQVDQMYQGIVADME